MSPFNTEQLNHLKPAREPVLFIQIPCYNEEETLGLTLDDLPREIDGISEVHWLIIDDGCTDKTVEVARAHGVDHIVRFRENQGLARGFSAGLAACVELGADIIVNTDADNQYHADDIATLVAPILNEKADIVIGARPIEDIPHFSPIKKLLQRLGSWVVRKVSNTDVADAPSGFRAMTRQAAKKLHVFGDYTYTIETVIQAGQKGMKVVSVPIRVNADLRPSRLVKSIWNYVMRSMLTMGRIFLIYRPLSLFLPLAIVCFIGGFALGVRYLFAIAMGHGAGHIQSVILCAMLLSSSVFIFLAGIMSDLISTNRKLLERMDWRLYQLDESIQGLNHPSTPLTTLENPSSEARIEEITTMQAGVTTRIESFHEESDPYR